MTTLQAQVFFFLALLIGALTLVYFIFAPFLAALIIAAIFAVLVHPVHRRIVHLMPRWPGAAALLTVLGTVLVILVPVGLLSVQVVTQAQDVYTSLSDGSGRVVIDSSVSKLEELLSRYVPGTTLSDLSGNLNSYMRSGLEWLIGSLGPIFSGFASFLVSLFVFSIAFFYFLRDGALLKRQLVALSPFHDSDDEIIATKLKLAIDSVVRGNLFIALIQGFSTGIGFWIFGVPNALLWGSIAVIGAMVPNLGTSIVFIPGIVYLLVTENSLAAVGLALWGATAVGLVDNFLGPQLISGKMNMHPLFILIAVLGGLALFGPIGIFLGPLTLSFVSALILIYRELSTTRT